MLSDMQSGRAMSASATLNSDVLPTLRPYLSKFENWNKPAAYLTAFLGSRRATPAEVEQRFTALAELVGEVDAIYAEFEEAAASLPRHSRVADLRAAFRRLQAMLRNAGAPTTLD